MLCGGEWVHGTRSYLKESSLFVWLVGSVSAMRTADLLLIRVVRFQCDSLALTKLSHLGRVFLVEKMPSFLQNCFEMYGLSYLTTSVPCPSKVPDLMFLQSLFNLTCVNRDPHFFFFSIFNLQVEFSPRLPGVWQPALFSRWTNCSSREI